MKSFSATSRSVACRATVARPPRGAGKLRETPRIESSGRAGSDAGPALAGDDAPGDAAEDARGEAPDETAGEGWGETADEADGDTPEKAVGEAVVNVSFSTVGTAASFIARAATRGTATGCRPEGEVGDQADDADDEDAEDDLAGVEKRWRR